MHHQISSWKIRFTSSLLAMSHVHTIFFNDVASSGEKVFEYVFTKMKCSNSKLYHFSE